MAATPTEIRVKLRLNLTPFIRSMHDVTEAFRAMPYATRGEPRPPRRPYPKRHSGLTAREYRASRRAYQRQVRAWKRGLA